MIRLPQRSNSNVQKWIVIIPNQKRKTEKDKKNSMGSKNQQIQRKHRRTGCRTYSANNMGNRKE